MISILIPYYKTTQSEEYLARCIASIKEQTFTDYEIVISEKGKASHNTNEGVKQCNGEIIKILCMDDYFTDKNALKTLVDNFKGSWLVHGVSNNQSPYITGDVHLGNNKLGGLSCMMFRKDAFIPFDESLVWLFDCDWHKQMIMKYGEPVIVNGNFVTIEEGQGQATNSISDNIKRGEVITMQLKYV